MRVLVVEDDLFLADCLTDALSSDGHIVCGVASTVAEAVASARLHRPDVAIVDVQLRGRERGSDAMDQLAGSGDLGQTGILYVTGQAEWVLREARVGHACLNKPYRWATLNAALDIVREIALEGGTHRPLPSGLQLLDTATMRSQPAA
jgi:CheY-like chemotaxis protein